VKAEQQIPRNALVWMIISLFTLVVPHAERIPVWVLLVYVLAALWRFMVYRGRWSFPRWPIKLGLIFAAFAGIHFLNEKDECENAPMTTWINESVALRERIYNTLYDNTDRETGLPDLSWNYQHDFLPLVEERLAAAGYRAAALLNKVYM
jgi:hypothetical protein